jgi:hypothetical protein
MKEDKTKRLTPFALLEDLNSRNSLTITQLRVAIHLALCRNSKTGRCNPAQKTVAKKLDLSERTVRYAIASLINEKILLSVRLSNRAPSAHYFFLHDLTHLNFVVNQIGNNYPELRLAMELLHSKK